MTHSLSRRSSRSGNESHDGFADIICGPRCSFLLCIATNFTNHNDCFGLRVRLKRSQAVNKSSAVHWVSTDSNACRLSFVNAHRLRNSLIGQGSGFANNPDTSFGMNMSWHDSNFCATAISRRYDSWAIGTNQSNPRSVFDIGHSFHHVECRDTLSNAHYNAFTFDAVKGISSFHYCFSGKGWRDIDDSCISVSCSNRFTHTVPHREWITLQLHGLTAFAGRTSTDNVCAVFDHLIGMEHALLSCNSLYQDFRIFFNPN